MPGPNTFTDRGLGQHHHAPPAARSSASVTSRPARRAATTGTSTWTTGPTSCFGVYTRRGDAISTSAPYNDGQWHHVVATPRRSNGMTLYVDGLRRSDTDADVTSGQPYSGYWRIGGDNLVAGRTSPPATSCRARSTTSRCLPDGAAASRCSSTTPTSGRTLDIPPAPTDAYGKAVYGDNAGPVLAAGRRGRSDRGRRSPNKSDGTYSGGVTYRTAEPGHRRERHRRHVRRQ